MAQILRNNIIIGTAAIKDLVVSDNSKTQQTVKFVRTVDQYENIDIPYDTFKEFEYGEVVIDKVFYEDIPASGGSVTPQISYHQTKFYKGHSGLRYLKDLEGGFVALKLQYNYVGEYVEGMFVKYNDVLTYQGKYYRCINKSGTSEKPFDGEVPPNNESLNGNYKEVGGPDTITDMGEWYSGIYVGYNQTVSLSNQIYKCVNPDGSFECPVVKPEIEPIEPELPGYGLYQTFGNELGGGNLEIPVLLGAINSSLVGTIHPDFVEIQKEYISKGARVAFSGKIVKPDGTAIVKPDGTVSTNSLGTTETQSSSLIDTVTVTVYLNGKTAKKTVNVYQSANKIVGVEYSVPSFIFSPFRYNTFGAVAEENVYPRSVPGYTQNKKTTYASQAVETTKITSGGVLKYERKQGGEMNFTIDTSTGAITTENRLQPEDSSGLVMVTVTLNGKTNYRTTTIWQEGVQRWNDGSVYEPRDIVSMGLDSFFKQDRLFIPLEKETTNPPLCIFRTFEDDALKFSNDGYILTGEDNKDDYKEILH